MWESADFDTCRRTVSSRKLYSLTLTYFLKVKNKNNISDTVLAGAFYLPLNDVIAKIVLCDLDLLFEANKFKILISLERCELAQK